MKNIVTIVNKEELNGYAVNINMDDEALCEMIKVLNELARHRLVQKQPGMNFMACHGLNDGVNTKVYGNLIFEVS